MAVRVVVSFPDQFTLQNRDLERLEYVQELGRHDRAVVLFFRDTNFPVTIDQIAGKDCRIQIYDDDRDLDPDRDVAFEGVVTEATQQHQLNGGAEWRVEIHSRSIFLDSDRNLRVFPRLTLPQVLQLVSPSISANGVPEREHEDFVQWGESDWDFTVRAADEAGCFVRPLKGKIEVRRGFEHKGSTVLWGRDLLALSVRAAPRNTGAKGWAYEVEKKESYVFRDRRQEAAFIGTPALASAVTKLSRTFPSTGDPLLLEHQSRAPTLGAFRERVMAESERALGSAIVVEGSSTVHRLAAGGTLTVDDSGNFKLPQPVGELGIVRLAHLWDGQQYRNEFVASPWDHYTYPEPRPRQILHGIVTAECVSIDDPAGLGRVQVRLHFQQPDDALLWARMVAPFAGNDRGIQFFPEIGDEVAVAFEEGDPGRPYVVGALWNGKDTPPDLKYKQIVTKSGNTIRVSDEKDKEAIQIFTPEGACMVELQNSNGFATLTIHSEGDIAIEAKEELRIRCKSLVQEVETDYLRKAGKSEKAAAGVDLTLTSTQVSLAADADLAISAGANLHASAGAMNNVVGAIVNLNPPGFVKMPISKASPKLKASVWSSQDGATEVTSLRTTFDPAPPRALAVTVPARAGRTAGVGAGSAFAPTTVDEIKTDWIEIQMVDPDGKPVTGLAFRIDLPDGTFREGVLDGEGRARFDGIEAGQCRITFPTLDKDSWEVA